MSEISTHVLDTVLGKPAAGIPVKLETKEGATWVEVATSATDADGRCRDLAQSANAGVYRITFDVVAYLHQKGRTCMYPEISITFICDGEAHYHLPLLLCDNSYTTYRGS